MPPFVAIKSEKQRENFEQLQGSKTFESVWAWKP
jgi:hypothetical protein